jgi:hypothetical protein
MKKKPIKNAQLTEGHIQGGLMLEYASTSEILLPNYTPFHWWECDLFRLSKTGFFTEYEIKLTRSDFAADKKKGHTISEWKDGKGSSRFALKHDLLAGEKQEWIPKMFYYVVPTNLIKATEVPAWAGLIYARRVSRHYVLMKIIKRAPSLHRIAMSEKMKRKAHKTVYNRYMYKRGERLSYMEQ